MAVLAYQIFIIFTIVLVRIVAKKHLIAACIVWTAFTFLNVFISPLLLLQLFTIWVSYALLKPKAVGTDVLSSDGNISANSSRAASVQPPTLPATSSPIIIETVLDQPKRTHKIAGTFDQFNEFLSSTNEHLNLRNEVQRATKQLGMAIYTEKLLINSALEGAKKKIELDKQLEDIGPEESQLFHESYSRLQKLLDDTKEGNTITLAPALTPIFDFPPYHDDPKIAEAIGNKIIRLREDRDQFISDTVDELRQDNTLLQAFKEKLENLNGHEIWRNISKTANARPGLVLTPQKQTNRALIDKILESNTTKSPNTINADDFGNKVKAIDIPYLVHFTRVENLASIIQHGLCPVSTLKGMRTGYLRNDSLRLDGYFDATSLSIAHPNDSMFYKYRMEEPQQDWAVLVLDRSILWEKKSAFCRHNAADSRVSKLPLADRMKLAAFDAMFLPSENSDSQEREHLKSYDPTDVQSEVLTFSTIEPKYILGVVFRNSRALEKYRDCLGDRRLSIQTEGNGFFAARSYCRKSGWSY